jgi:hypothetical protein
MQLKLSAVTVRTLSLVLAVVLMAPSHSRAGGGPENVLLVVNSRSWSSLSVANHYIRLRKIPAINVLYLDWDGPLDRIDVGTFRTRLLEPILAAIEERQLGEHVDYIVYSSDFPWSIDARPELAAGAGSGRLADGFHLFLADDLVATGRFSGDGRQSLLPPAARESRSAGNPRVP